MRIPPYSMTHRTYSASVCFDLRKEKRKSFGRIVVKNEEIEHNMVEVFEDVCMSSERINDCVSDNV